MRVLVKRLVMELAAARRRTPRRQRRGGTLTKCLMRKQICRGTNRALAAGSFTTLSAEGGVRPGVYASLLYTGCRGVAASCPVGASDGSPAIYRWVIGRQNLAESPVGTTEMRTNPRLQSSLFRDSGNSCVARCPSTEVLGYLRSSLRDGRTPCRLVCNNPARPAGGYPGRAEYRFAGAPASGRHIATCVCDHSNSERQEQTKAGCLAAPCFRVQICRLHTSKRQPQTSRAGPGA